jgi:hypothetical protein
LIEKACTDPFLDDNITMAKKLKNLKVDSEILIVDNGTPHGFLNMQSLSSETHDAFQETLKHMRRLINHFEEEKKSQSTSQQPVYDQHNAQ